MSKYSPFKTALLFMGIVVLVVGLSLVSNRMWGGRPEQPAPPKTLLVEEEMTLSQFGQANDLPNSVLKEIFGLQAKSDLGKKVNEYGTADQVAAKVVQKLALASEHATKNWIKIPVKFGLWFLFLTAVFIHMRRRKRVSGLRKGLLFLSVLLFGVIMGADPSPMGTVKDAIYLYGTTHAIFPPRLIALTIFLTIVFVANKYICGWGCQAGALQDLIFQINQTDQHQAIIGRQIKLPFALTNSVRFLFLSVFTLVTFALGIDIIASVDPFRIFKPAHLEISGAIFLATLLCMSLFMYRPWCHLFCPFGLVSWLVEKTSLVRISVNYETCIACQKCAATCPSTVMSAILRQDKKTIPDCFACYACREVCPTDSISFSLRKKTLPPAFFWDKD